MKITIDTKKDTKEEIMGAFRFIKALLEDESGEYKTSGNNQPDDRTDKIVDGSVMMDMFGSSSSLPPEKKDTEKEEKKSEEVTVI